MEEVTLQTLPQRMASVAGSNQSVHGITCLLLSIAVLQCSCLAIVHSVNHPVSELLAARSRALPARLVAKAAGARVSLAAAPWVTA